MNLCNKSPIPESQTDQASKLDIPSTQDLIPIFEELYAHIDELELDKGNKDETKSRALEEEVLEEEPEEIEEEEEW